MNKDLDQQDFNIKKSLIVLWGVVIVLGLLAGVHLIKSTNYKTQLKENQFKLDSVSLELTLFRDSVKRTISQIDTIFIYNDIKIRSLNNVSLVHKRVLYKLDSTSVTKEYNYVQQKLEEAKKAGFSTVTIPNN